MKPSVFLKLLLLSSLLTSGILFFALRWTSPPTTLGNYEQETRSAGPPSLSSDEENNIEVYKRISPGVVNITSTSIEYDFFFEPVPRQGIGSGCVIDVDGHVLTNNHVIRGADKLEVTLFDKSKYPAQVVGADPIGDIAIVKINAPRSKLHPIAFSTAVPQIGQKVLAIGNPFGLEQTLTTGIVSAMNRSIRTENGILMNDLVQTDAAINPGNSGGPLVNASGEMIGINTSIFSPSGGGSIGIGFAVGARTLSRVVPQLVSEGRVVRPSMGIRGQALFPELAEALSLPVDRGVMVIAVEPGSTADASGIRGGDRRVRIGNVITLIGGDIIVEIDGQAISAVSDIDDLLKDRSAGEKVSAVIYRGSERQKLTLTLVEKSGGRSGLRF